MEKRVVVHAIRGYLARTETFVGNQIRTLEKHSPVVISHHRSENAEFDIDAMYVIDEQYPTAMQKSMGRVSYAFFRTLTPFEVKAAAAWAAPYAPKLMHFHFAVDAAFFFPLYNILRIPAVVSLYGYDVSAFPKIMGGMGRRFLRRAFNTMEMFLAMSQDMKRDAMGLGVPEEKITVHYHGINTSRFRYDRRQYEDRGEYHVLAVGTLEPKKGQNHLLRAVAALRSSRPDISIRVTLVGTGPMMGECQRIVSEKGLQDRVTFAGYIPHLSLKLLEYYRQADVFVHFSRTQPDGDKEGIPGTIVEAMASGLPVITTRHAGIPEVIVHGQQGILLDESDTDGIARALAHLHDHPERRANIGRAAAFRALNDLDVRTKTRNLERIYEDVARCAQKRSNSLRAPHTVAPGILKRNAG